MERQDSEKRGVRRASVRFVADLKCGGFNFPAELRNLSEDGTMLTGKRLPPPGCTLEFERNGTMVRGRMIWAEAGRGGLRFEAPVDVKGLLRKIPPRRQIVQPCSQRPGLRSPRLRRSEREGLDYWIHHNLPTARNG